MYYLYRHTCPNNKVYIGITCCSPEVRWQGGYGYKNNSRFFKDILYYGWSNIKHEILAEDLTKEEALQMENAQILLHNSILPQYGYNQSCTDQSAHNRAVNQYSTEGVYITTHKSVKDAAQLVSAHPSTITYACNNHGVSRGYLWKFTEDTAELVIPKDLSRRVHSKHKIRTDVQGKSIAQYTKDGFLICTYSSAKEASEKTGVNQGDICSCCKGKKGSKGRIKHTAGGFIWKYTNEKEIG